MDLSDDREVHVEVKEISKKYPKSQFGIDKISFDIKKNEFFGILGNNGSGKSTLISILTGLTKADSGSVSISPMSSSADSMPNIK